MAFSIFTEEIKRYTIRIETAENAEESRQFRLQLSDFVDALMKIDREIEMRWLEIDHCLDSRVSFSVPCSNARFVDDLIAATNFPREQPIKVEE